MTTDALFGPINGLPDIEKAVLNQLETWLPPMITVVERRKGVPIGTIPRPDGRHSYYGGLDFQSVREDALPCVIVVTNPVGNTERAAGVYGQWFELQVGLVFMTESEDESRMMAGYAGMAVPLAVAQHGGLGGIASRTEMLSSPAVEFIDPDIRRLVLSRTVFRSFVGDLVDEAAGAKVPAPPVSPQYPGAPDEPWLDVPTVIRTPVTLAPVPAE